MGFLNTMQYSCRIGTSSTFLPFTDTSFSQIAAETCPALNFATGFCPAILFHLEPSI